MIPIISDLLAQPGVMVGMGLGVCIGFFMRGSLLGNGETVEEGDDEDNDGGWDEVSLCGSCVITPLC